MSQLTDMLIRHEGKRVHPYTDTVGKLTIGVGRNLTDVGLSDDEIAYLLTNDIQSIIGELRRTFVWYSALVPARQDALADMGFNLGLTKLKKFILFLAAMERGSYEEAANEMIASMWAKQVGDRAYELAAMIRMGVYQ